MANRRITCRAARRTAGTARRGVIMVAVIVCVAVASIIFLSIAKLVVAGRQAAQTETWQLQARWLAESGLERAASRLAADADYSGETWTVPADAIGGSEAGLVEIAVEAVPDEPGRHRVLIRADYPDLPHRRTRHTKQAIVQLPAAADVAETGSSTEIPGENDDTNVTEEEP